jgi:hypothetical protein
VWVVGKGVTHLAGMATFNKQTRFIILQCIVIYSVQFACEFLHDMQTVHLTATVQTTQCI